MQIDKIRELLEDTITSNGYTLDNVIYEKEGSLNYLKIIIDKEPMIEIEDCVKVSKLINPILDEKDPIEENYILDVCSKEKGK